jgi:hypothetical protein
MRRYSENIDDQDMRYIYIYEQKVPPIKQMHFFILGFCILLRVLYQGDWKSRPPRQLFKAFILYFINLYFININYKINIL